MDSLALKVDSITKSFGTFCANKDVCLTLKRGEILAVLGENGAGKSTLMNVLCGLYNPDCGSVVVYGEEMTSFSPSHSMQLGMGMVHQHFMLIENLTGYENIILGATKKKTKFLQRDSFKEEIKELSERYGLIVDLDTPVYQMAVGEQQRIEILKVLWRGSDILILDEPTAVLTDEETTELISIIKNLASEGRSVIFISHKLREVMELSDRVIVMRAGQVVADKLTRESDEQDLANLMIGRQMPKHVIERVDTEGLIAVDIKNVSYNLAEKHSRLNDITLSLHKGEILGVAGVDGNGQSELAKLITGLLKPDEGELFIKGDPMIGLYDPMTLILKDVSHIPEDRNKMGLVGEMSIEENLMMKSRHRDDLFSLGGLIINRKKVSEYAREIVDEYSIACTSEKQSVTSLSGGNQQKVVLARELEQEPDVLVAVHPTRGLDVGAAAFIHEKIANARDVGCAVVYISTDLPEVLKVSDVIVVMYEGTIMGIYDGKNPNVESIALAIAGKKSE